MYTKNDLFILLIRQIRLQQSQIGVQFIHCAIGFKPYMRFRHPGTTEYKDSLLFTRPIILNKQVLVQRKPEKENDSLYIHSQLELARKTLHLVKNSPAILRIHNLSNEIGDTIYIKEVEKYGQEQLLAMVAHGDIDYAVCDESIAKASINDFPQLDIETAISFSQFYSWGVSKHSPILLDSLNSWLNDYVKTPAFKLLRKKYYNN